MASLGLKCEQKSEGKGGEAPRAAAGAASLGAASLGAASVEPLLDAVRAGNEARARPVLAALRRAGVLWARAKLRRGGNTALHLAARHAPLPLLQLLCESCRHDDPYKKDCDNCRGMLEIRNAEGQTCLYVAADICRAAVVEYLLERGADAEAPAADGRSALMAACARGPGLEALQTVRVLVERGGAQVARRAPDGWTALHAAARGGCAATLALLLERCFPGSGAGAPAKAKAKNGKQRYKDSGLVLPGPGGRSPLHLAALHGREAAAEALLRAAEAVGGQAAAEAALEARDAAGLTPLHEAVRGGHVGVVRALKRRGARLHRADAQGRSCLHFAAEAGRAHVLRFLLAECRMWVDAPSKSEGLTALHCALRAGHVDCVRTLLAFGADPTRRDARGRSAQDFLSGLNNDELEALVGSEQTSQQEGNRCSPIHFFGSSEEISI